MMCCYLNVQFQGQRVKLSYTELMALCIFLVRVNLCVFPSVSVLLFTASVLDIH